MTVLTPVSKGRLSEAAADSILQFIRARELSPGDRLPTERELTEALGISRASVREALRFLEIGGVIEVKPGSGIYFIGWADDLAIPLAVWLPRNEETVREGYEVRETIEPRAAAFAAQRASPEAIADMEAALDSFRQCFSENNLAGMILADIDFHMRVTQGTKNKTLMLIMKSVTTNLIQPWKASLRVPRRPEKTILEHRSIIDAIKAHKPEEARNAMADHLARAVEEIEESQRESP